MRYRIVLKQSKVSEVSERMLRKLNWRKFEKLDLGGELHDTLCDVIEDV